VASFYLNRHFHAKELEHNNQLLHQLVENRNQIIKAKDDLIISLSNDYKTHDHIIDSYKKEVMVLEGNLKSTKKELKLEKIKSKVCIAGLILIALIK
jgi:hypothetical protein